MLERPCHRGAPRRWLSLSEKPTLLFRFGFVLSPRVFSPAGLGGLCEAVGRGAAAPCVASAAGLVLARALCSWRRSLQGGGQEPFIACAWFRSCAGLCEVKGFIRFVSPHNVTVTCQTRVLANLGGKRGPLSRRRASSVRFSRLLCVNVSSGGACVRACGLSARVYTCSARTAVSARARQHSSRVPVCTLTLVLC